MPKKVSSLADHYIVGIGASAGGLEAILEFFDSIPQDISCSFIIVQHLSPEYKSMMPELLERHTRMHIQEAAEDMVVKPNSIYVIPHKKNLAFRFGKLKLTEKLVNKVPNNAIDVFLTSLAQDKKEKAIGIILSGTGSDGSKGLEAIKSCGGLTMVQDPVTAKFDGMPNSAINTGCVDFVLSPELMHEELLHHIHAEPTKGPSLGSEKDEELMDDILNFIKSKTGQDFSQYKRPTITRRIAKRLSLLNMGDLQQYKDYLRKNEQEAHIMGKEFLIGVTRFFRDQKAFDLLDKEIIPAILKQKKEGDIVKVWTAGCSTGEEAYSIAMLFQKHLAHQKKELEVKIFATDIDKDAIDYAAKGMYPVSIEKDIPEDMLKSCFEEHGNKYRVLPSVRKMVVFAVHDLVRNAPYSKMDLISCRNVLIYFSQILQKSIISKFHFSLNPHGYLFLGPSENLGEFENTFLEVNKKLKIYQNPSTKPSITKDLHLGSTYPLTPQLPRLQSEGLGSHFGSSYQSLSNILLKECNYGAVYINEHFELVQATGDYHKYIHLPKNNLDLNILKMIPEDLAALMGSAVRKAGKTGKRISLNGIKVRVGKKTRLIDATIVPVQDSKFLKKFFWLLFKEGQKDRQNTETLTYSPEDFSNQEHISEIEKELFDTKERLQAAVEELETSNEEMQSSNEELVSANEELQSTNEELQSLNEELHTVNSEHQLKIKELIELNDDLNNYFRSTDIGKVFVDKNLLIRKFTPAAIKQINLISSDIGRPISHISNNIIDEHLISDIKRTIDNSETLEREIQTKNNRWYLMKILPYLKLNKTTDGAIISFVDVTSFKQLNLLVSAVLNSSVNAILAFKAIRGKKNEIVDFECLLANDVTKKILHTEDNPVGKTILETPWLQQKPLFERYKEVVETGKPFHIEYFHPILNSWLEIVSTKMDDGFAVTLGDINDKKQSEEKIKKAYEELSKTQGNLRNLNNELEQRVTERTKELSISQERFVTLSLATNDAIWDWDFVSQKVWWNEGFKKLFGYSNEEMEGVGSWFNKIHPEDKERIVNGIQEVISSGNKQWSDEYRLRKSDGTYATILDRAYVLSYQDGSPYRMLGSMVDLTSLKRVQTELEETNRNLRKINTDLDNFIYTASHDLKAPISNIEGLMDALQDLTDNEDKEVLYILGMVRKSAERFKETINALTDVAKIQKEFEEEPELLDIKEIIEEVKFSIQHLFTSSRATLRYHLEQPHVKFSKKNFRSIVYNLISNAIKYRDPERLPVIDITSQKQNNNVLLIIQDNGLGIDNIKVKQIFGMFKRFHTHVEGTGIGLYMVKRIVDNAGGVIEVSSDPGKGTTFKISLKADNKQPKTQPLAK